MKQKASLIIVWLAAACLASVLLGGCATRAVWEEGAFLREPAIPTDLRLFHSSQRADILVEYNEYRGLHKLPRRRAYWLEANRDRLRSGRQPHFVPPGELAGLAPIPVFLPPIRYADLPTIGLY